MSDLMFRIDKEFWTLLNYSNSLINETIKDIYSILMDNNQNLLKESKRENRCLNMLDFTAEEKAYKIFRLKAINFLIERTIYLYKVLKVVIMYNKLKMNLGIEEDLLSIKDAPDTLTYKVTRDEFMRTFSDDNVEKFLGKETVKKLNELINKSEKNIALDKLISLSEKESEREYKDKPINHDKQYNNDHKAVLLEEQISRLISVFRLYFSLFSSTRFSSVEFDIRSILNNFKHSYKELDEYMEENVNMLSEIIKNCELLDDRCTILAKAAT